MVDLSKIDAVKERLSIVEGHMKSGLTGEDKVFLDRINYLLFGKEVSNKGCGNCYRDAYIFCSLKLREMDKMPKFDYQLKAGAVLVEPMTGKSYVGGVPADVAIKFLRANKAKWLPLFAVIPDDLDARLSDNAPKDEPKAEDTAEKIEKEEAESDTAEVEQTNKRKVGRPKKF